MSSVFEPDVALVLLKNSAGGKAKPNFEKDWKSNIATRIESWKKNRQNQSCYGPQLAWAASVVEFVNFIHQATKVPKNAKDKSPRKLSKDIPFFGPRFIPPTLAHRQRRQGIGSTVTPSSSYLRPLLIVHPVFFPELLRCPGCGSRDVADVYFDGWNATGHREVHGVHGEETALGYQLRCKACEKRLDEDGRPRKHCWSTTSIEFWDTWAHWEIPYEIPHFLKRCALTRDLFDLLVELRPSTTAGGLAEHIKQLHLLQYHRQRLAYLNTLLSCVKSGAPFAPTITPFSTPTDPEGYDGSWVTDDIITDVYGSWSTTCRAKESSEYMKTLDGICLSLDATFKFARKASIVTHIGDRERVMRGGLLTVINEHSEELAWRLCQTGHSAEMREMLDGVAERFKTLNIEAPVMAVVDNCCSSRAAIQQALPQTAVVLDVYHFKQRYMVTILNGVRNPHYRAVGSDISGSILRTRASNGKPATYWSQSEQEGRLIEAWEKWLRQGGVWSAASTKVHLDQLAHVRKGCLTRTREDISTDGSRIETSHKQWNLLMRCQASGLANMLNLGYDFTHRRNSRLGQRNDDMRARRPFLASGHGSHHTALTNHTNHVWNDILDTTRTLHVLDKKAVLGLVRLPVLPDVKSGETFGVVHSTHAETFGGLYTIKEEEDEDDEAIQLRLVEEDADVLQELKIDPALLQLPLDRSLPPIAASNGPVLANDAATSVIPSQRNASPANNSTVTTTSVTAHVDVLKEGIFQGATSKDIDQVPGPGSSSETDGCDTAPVIDLTSEVADEDTPPTNTRAIGRGKRKANQLDCVSLAENTNLKRPRAAEGPSIPLGARTFNATKGPVPKLPPANTSASSLNQFLTRFGMEQIPSTSGGELPEAGPSTISQDQRPPLATDIKTLSRRLPAPPGSTLPPSSQLFSNLTKVHAGALSIGRGDEYFLFMDMRAERGWASFKMNNLRWAQATNEYNARLQKKTPPSQHYDGMKKHPRALIDKLASTEAAVLQRINTKNYTSQQGNDRFWKRHCFAVNLGKHMDEALHAGRIRKAMVCSRCQTLMYPKPSSKKKAKAAGATGTPVLAELPGDAIIPPATFDGIENHKRDCCADGGPVKPKDDMPEVPPWPQPSGVFSNGTTFHVLPFLQAVQSLYQKTVEEAQDVATLDAEHQAFATMFKERLLIETPGETAGSSGLGHLAYFRLYEGLHISDENAFRNYYMVKNGKRYLRIDCLRDTDAIPLPDNTAPSEPKREDGSGSNSPAESTSIA